MNPKKDMETYNHLIIIYAQALQLQMEGCPPPPVNGLHQLRINPEQYNLQEKKWATIC
jgi:hypothetical protein